MLTKSVFTRSKRPDVYVEEVSHLYHVADPNQAQAAVPKVLTFLGRSYVYSMASEAPRFLVEGNADVARSILLHSHHTFFCKLHLVCTFQPRKC